MQVLFAVVVILVWSVECQVVVNFVDSSYEVVEGDRFNVRISKTGIYDKAFNVIVEIENDVNNDFVGDTQVARYEARSADSEINVTFAVNDDNIPEDNEVFYLHLYTLDNNILVGNNRRILVTVKANDDAYGVFSISEVSPLVATEYSYTSVAQIKVKREVSFFGQITVTYMVNSSSPDAVVDGDVKPAFGSLVFQPGQKDGTIQIQIIADDIPEDQESFFITLSSASNGARILPKTLELVVLANDSPVRFSAAEYRFDEGPGTRTVSVAVTRGLMEDGRSLGPVAGTIYADFNFVSKSALQGSDFLGKDGTVGFGPGEIRKFISFDIIDDTVPELEENFDIRLLNLRGDAVFISPSVATVIINANDNPSGILSFKPDTQGNAPFIRVNEDTFTTVEFQVLRSDGTFGNVTVRWFILRLGGSSAPVTDDIGPAEGLLVFANGQNEAKISLTVVQDNNPEPSEMFSVNLTSNSVTGQAKVEGITSVQLLIEDSDNMYGTVEFGPGTENKLITNQSPRQLQLSITRSGGRDLNLLANITVSYIDNTNTESDGVFVNPLQSIILPASEDPVLAKFELRSSTFLVIGGVFKALIANIDFQTPPMYAAYNSPKIGARQSVSISVSSSEANGETGFFNVSNQVVDEPSTGVSQVNLLVSREGMSGRAVIKWSLSGKDVTADDVTALQGNLTLESGMSETFLTIGIKADDIPEVAEYMIVTLDSIEPSDTQRLRPGLTSVTITINANDNPGGDLQFSSKMNSNYTIAEGGDAVDVIIERIGGSLIESSVQYSIEPNGADEFYGATNILVFPPGVNEASARILAKKDGIPELAENFRLVLTSVKQSVIGTRNVIYLTIPANDNPYGVIQFFTDPTLIYTGEGQTGEQINVTLPVQRDYGTFGTVNVSWRITPSPQNDLSPSSGLITFDPGQSVQYIKLSVVNDDIPEQDETYAVQLSAPQNGAISGIPMVATIIIRENDNPVEFTQMVMYVSEPQNITLTVTRQGKIDAESRVHYRTLDGSASFLEGDYTQIPTTQLLFPAGQRERSIQVSVLDDNIPEGNETFSVQLFDVAGDLIVTSNSTATIVILANDDAYGVFNFSQPADAKVEEGSTVYYDILRSRGSFGSVRVYWELRSSSNVLLAPGDEFAVTSGYVDFSSQESQRPLAVTPLADGIPEPDEQFFLTITRLDVLIGITNGNLASLAKTGTVATVRVPTSDDPYGRMAFLTRDLEVAEDFYPGNEASTRANFVVERRQGTQNKIQVLWEIVSDKLGGSLPQVYDLLFTGQWPGNVASMPSKQRAGTATPVALFSGVSTSFITVTSDFEPALSDLSSGFSLSAWVLPVTGGYIVARCTSDGNTHFYSLKLTTTSATTSLQLRLSTKQQSNQLFTVDVNTGIVDGKWHHILVSVWNTLNFYLDGKLVGSSSVSNFAMLEGSGSLLVGARTPGTELFSGYMQDVRIFMRALENRSVAELFTMPSIQDVTPISGILTYDVGVKTQNFTVSSIQDTEEESREIFIVILLDTVGGATLASTDSRTTLAVMKSDNANGLFGFSGDCNPSRVLYENATITCTLLRTRGDAGTVTLSWVVNQKQNQVSLQATTDFDNSNGTVVFLPGERNKTFDIRVTDDTVPELDELFEVVLTSAVSDDGLVGSTNTSGASIDPTKQTAQLSIAENDYPYGYLQFSNRLGVPPAPFILIPPNTAPIEVSVSEEGGLVPLVVLRAQGNVGTIRTEWRTIDTTAFSEGKSPPDYVGGVGSVVMNSGQNYAWINITVIDNSLPEAEKKFVVELLNPSGGAVLSQGSQKVTVTIQASDGAFGVFQFSDTSLSVRGTEDGDDGFNIVSLQVNRLLGTIGTSRVAWEVDEDKADGLDIINQSGNLTFLPGQTSQSLDLQVRGDTIPELDEIVRVRLVLVYGGTLGDPLRINATITIAANDDPYGRFIITPAFRPVRVMEIDQDVNITVQRQAGKFGTVEVDFVSLSPTEVFSYLPVGVARADLNDFNATRGTLIFGANQEFALFKLHILDDQIPEEDESIFVRLTTVRITQAAQLNPVPSSPRLGQNTDTYGQIIITANDDASGRLELSPSNISVAESDPTPGVYLTRTGGSFGQVSVPFRVIDGTAVVNMDYVVLSNVIILAAGETRKRVPVEIIDDRVPEMAEYFTIELIDQVMGGAVLGARRTSVITIQVSDDPNGVFTFVAQGQTVDELEKDYSVNITIARTGGSMDVVTVNWEATLNGVPASDDIFPASGQVYFVTNEASRNINITILADNIPEGTENILVRLTNATNGGRIGDQNVFILSIAPNDSPYGTVQLSSAVFSVAEDPADGSQTAQVVRSGGVYSSLRIFYSTSAMTLIDLINIRGDSVMALFLAPVSKIPFQTGTFVNVTLFNDTLKACASACVLETSCLSFQYGQTPDKIICNWYANKFSNESFQPSSNSSYYEKDGNKVSELSMYIAKAGDDFTVVSRASVIIGDGQSSVSILLPIINDNIPELDEQFYLRLLGVELVNSSGATDAPSLGPLQQASIIIATNDKAFGMFSIYSASNTSARVIQVLESNQLAVDLVVERQGGSIGSVSVEWSVSTINRTATYGQDYIADGATLLFGVAQTRRVISITILDDNIPEDNEEMTIVLSNPKGGATLSDMNSVRIVLLANDYVAGVLTFEKTSVLTKEGDKFQMKLKRSLPASGTVSTNWSIEDKNGQVASQRFAQSNGTLVFLPLQTERVLNLSVIVDNIPKVDEEYQLKLQNITTQGVPPSGWAVIDPQLGTVLMTIVGSNDPHGVFQLAASSLEVRVQESAGTANLLVDRKFGAIGVVRVSYEAVQGSLKPYGTQRNPASVGQDFIGVQPGFIDIGNGESSGTISITIIDDSIPEIDEVFVVRLLGVSLIYSTNTTLPPRLASNGTEAEVIIVANDGAQGIMQFATDSQNVDVTEQGQTISLTVLRGNGTFGQVSVFVYSQAVTQSTVLGQDYNMTAGELVFQEGESRKVINVTILDDNEPEPDETFQVILANPSNGALLGQAVRASVKILANDIPGGYVSFDTPDAVRLREPTPDDSSYSKVDVIIRRGPGAYGTVTVPYTILTSSGNLTTDILRPSGTVTFTDRQDKAVLVLEVVDDDEPEDAEMFTLSLQAPSGGAILGNTTVKTINIDASDSPAGYLQIYFTNNSGSVISVDEAFATVEIDVIRSKGTKEKVTVDVLTVPGTATSFLNMSRVVLAPMCEVNAALVSAWHQVNIGDAVYLVLLTSLPQDTQLSSMLSPGSSVGSGQSVMYKWQGQATYVSTFASNGAAAATSFTISNITYLVVANSGREGARQVPSTVYRISQQGLMEIVQTLTTSGASSVRYFMRDSRHFLFVTNSLDDTSKSDINSYVFEWDSSLQLFTSTPKQLISTLFARASVTFNITGQIFIAVANFYDRTIGSYEINSVIYRLESDFSLVEHQRLATQGAISMTYTEIGTLRLLVVANNRQNAISTPQNSIVYRWDPLVQAFVLHQTLPTSRALRVTSINTNSSSVFLIFACEVGKSEIFIWDVQSNSFKSAWTGSPYLSLQPIIIRQPSGYLLMLASADVNRLNKPVLFQVAQIADNSDFVSRQVTMTFEAGQTSLRTSVVILSDDLPEDEESFQAVLTSPTGGADIGYNSSVRVVILSNDDAYGIIEFSQDSLAISAEERNGMDTPVNLNILRKKGFSGHVSVQWQATGDQGSIGDIRPLAGLVEFASGQSIATITLTVLDDKEPELAEVTYIRLTQVIDAGTTDITKGAKLGDNTVAVLTVLANDSPFGVVSWEKTLVIVNEPEKTDQPIELGVVREQGLEQALRVYYVTSAAVQLPVYQQATPGEDFVTTQGFVRMAEGVSRAVVVVVIKQDDIPEAAENFLVNLTSVSLENNNQGQVTGPSIAIGKGVVQVTIAENDNAQGIIEMDVKTNVEGRMDVYEEYGRNVTIELPLKRSVGFFGSLTVTWQAEPIEADLKDFTPASGTVQFNDLQRNASIFITILDDTIPENMETFDVRLISVTGDAGIGASRRVRVAILKNDSPTGLFRFAVKQVETREAKNTTDKDGQATLIVQRIQGSQGYVNVQWRLNAEAASDFMPPLENTILFAPGETEKQITLQTKPDSVLEGREEFVVSLVAADNNADISNRDGDCKVIILPDPGASGVIVVLPEYRSLMVGEPGESSPSYSGGAEIKLTRGLGIFGEVVVTWSITPRDSSAFLQIEGSVTFTDLQQVASVVIQTRDDSVPELRQMFTLQITSATGGAVISSVPGEFTASILFAASDYPHGLIQFALPEVTVVTEDQGTVYVTVQRTKGLIGQLQVAYSTSSGSALSNVDFLPAAGVLTFQNGIDTQTISINIIPDDVPEGPEDFYVNLTSVQLVGDSNNYTLVNGLSPDMRPGLGTLTKKILRIDKNDNAEGIIQFDKDTYSVKEESLMATLLVTRTRGDYGEVRFKYETRPGTATENVDYMASSGEMVLSNGVRNITINITIIDDALMEPSETFTVLLTSVAGGAMLGIPITSTVTILKSDYPNGKFSFVGSAMINLPNPEVTVRQLLTVERTGGLQGQQQVFWRIMGPNNPTLQLLDTSDISSLINGQEVTMSSLVWSDGESGKKTITLDIKPYTSWEIEKSFIVELYRVSASPASAGDGEIDDTQGKITVKIERFGDPSGVIIFSGVATTERLVLEPEGSSPDPFVFPVTRKSGTGVTGNIKIYWEVRGIITGSLDVSPVEGSLILEDGKRDGEIILQILPDDIPELTHVLTLVLLRIEGGAQIDSQFNQSTFRIRYNDDPHGNFGLVPQSQSVQVNAADLSRFVSLNFTRFQGAFGSVLVTYTIIYDLPSSDVGLSFNTGTVTFNDGSHEVITQVNIVGRGFLQMNSVFKVTITDVQFLGTGMTEAPKIIQELSTAQIQVPALAANTEISFTSNLAFVNEADATLTVTLFRAGTYGIIVADWVSGYSAADLPSNVTNGETSPTMGSVTMLHGQEQANITVQVLPKIMRTEAFVLRLPRSPQTLVSGGARLAKSNIIVVADPSGVVRFSEDSLTAEVSELEGQVTLTLWRYYGSENPLLVHYQTVADSAQAGLDFQSVQAGYVVMEAQKTVTSFTIQIYQDNIPEVTEYFYVNLTSVEKFPTPLQPAQSPRLSQLKSLAKIAIKESNDPYGVLWLRPNVVNISESFVNVTFSVVRTGGLFGTVSVTVRTVGGGEAWTSQISANPSSLTNDTIADIIGKRSSQEIATAGLDYDVLNTAIVFQAQESEKSFRVTILEDNLPEPSESVLIYLTQPTGGARIAAGSSDGGQRGYAVINIAASDMSNGLIGFAESSKDVHANEDTTPQLVLKLTRLNAFYGAVKVYWKAKKALNSTDQEDADLINQLDNVSGYTACPANSSDCDLIVNIKNDTIPEESYTFYTILTGTEIDARLNDNSLYAFVTIDPSDDVRGLIQFSLNSREIIVGESARTAQLSIEKVNGQNYDVSVAYNTQQMTERVTVSSVYVYPALDAQDFRGQTGTLAFPAKTQTIQNVDISLTPVLASNNPLPKQFYVTLYSPTNGARVNPKANRAIVRIVKDGDVPIWAVVSRPEENPFSDDGIVLSVIGQLDGLVQKPLTNENIQLVENILNKVNQEGSQRKFPTEVLTAVKNLYCKLLDSAINDARKGRSSLSPLLENFSYTLIKDKPCPPVTANDVTSIQCSAVTITAGRWNSPVLLGYQFQIQAGDTFTLAKPMPELDTAADGTKDDCVDFHLLDFNTQTWFFTTDGKDNLMNERVVNFGLRGRLSGSIPSPVKFRIHTPNNRIAAKDAKCVYFDESLTKWVSPAGVCQVTNDLSQAEDDFVDCECSHMTSYGVIATSRDSSIVGYLVWFYVICFICMGSIVLTVCIHHLCFRRATFSAGLHMHFLMSIFFFELCLVVDAFLSPDNILVYNTKMDNSKCIAMGLFLHYFFLAQFTWIATQSVNLWKVLVMNDEHTDRHYIVFFVIGWGVPLILMAIFYAVTFNIFKYHTNLPVDFIYGDVNNNAEICFITNAYVALGGILAPVLVSLLVVGVVFVKAYQLSSQWQFYDDFYHGRHNAKEIPLLLLLWAVLYLTCLWLALHMIYGFLWMMVLFCIFNLTLAILVFLLYAIVRNPHLAWIFGPKRASYSVSADEQVHDDMTEFPEPDKDFMPYNTATSFKGSHTSLINDAWENNTAGRRSRMTVRRALPSQVYMNPPVAIISPSATVQSDNPDFDDLIYALKLGRSLSPSEFSRSFDDDVSQMSIVLDRYETKRIDIADTHL